MSSTGRFTTTRAGRGHFEEEKQVYTSKQATVEVTVKVKKRRHHDHESKGGPLPSKSLNFRKGSWGDLLSHNKLAEVKEDLRDGRTKTKHMELKCSASEDGDSPRSLCHKIPINDDIYLETHTHVRSKSSSPYDRDRKEPVVTTIYSSDQNRNRRAKNYEVENDYLRGEIERLRKEIEKVNLKSQKKKTTGRAEDSYASYIKRRPTEIIGAPSSNTATVATQSRVKNRQQQPPPPVRRSETKSRLPPQIPTESKQTSTTSIAPVILVEKRSEITQTDGRSPVKERLVANQKQMDLMLEEENKALRKEAGSLLAEMQKAQREQQESIMTIRELYQLAELLKRENQELLGAQEQQQFLQEKLVEAISENQDLKKYLDTLVQKQKECTNEHGDQMAKIRNVIEEVKSTIQDEIHGISGSQASVFDKPEYSRAFNLNLTEEQSSLLNETNSSEVQRILGLHEESFKQIAKEAFMKATGQMPQDQGLTSTPTPSGVNSGRSSASQQSQHRRSPNTKDAKSGRNNDKGSGINLESLTQDVSRTFKPIQTELMNGSSSSEYRSTTSTPTNING